VIHRQAATLRPAATLALMSATTLFADAADRDEPFFFQVLKEGDSFFSTSALPQARAYVAFQSAAEWVSFWSVPGRLALQGSKPPRVNETEIDFDRFTLLFISPGQKPTSGYITSITSVWNMGSKLRVAVVNVNPVADGIACAIGPVETYPHVLALIPKARKPVVFEISKSNRGRCSHSRELASGE
jgi:hypothetical protein